MSLLKEAVEKEKFKWIPLNPMLFKKANQRELRKLRTVGAHSWKVQQQEEEKMNPCKATGGLIGVSKKIQNERLSRKSQSVR